MLGFLAACLTLAAAPDAPFAIDGQTLLLAHFDSGLAADYAAGAPNPSGAAGLTDGKFGHAADFRRGLALSRDGVRLPFKAPAWSAADNLDPSQGTLEFWFRPAFGDAPPADGQRLHYLFDCRRGTAEGVVLVIIEAADGRRTLQFWEKLGDASENGLQVDITDWTPGTWRHLALTWRGVRRTLWLDAEPVAKHDAGPDGLAVMGEALRFGSVAWDAHEADGSVDELRISDVVRYEE